MSYWYFVSFRIRLSPNRGWDYHNGEFKLTTTIVGIDQIREIEKKMEELLFTERQHENAKAVVVNYELLRVDGVSEGLFQ